MFPCMSDLICFCTVWKDVEEAWQHDVQKINSSHCTVTVSVYEESREHALMRNSTLLVLVGLIYHLQNNFVKSLGIIYLIHNTQLCKLWLWHMSRFSTRFCGGSPSGSLSGSRGVRSQSSCTESGPIHCWPDCSASRSQPTQANGVQLFSRDLRLLGSNIAVNRRPRQAGSGHHSTGP